MAYGIVSVLVAQTFGVAVHVDVIVVVLLVDCCPLYQIPKIKTKINALDEVDFCTEMRIADTTLRNVKSKSNYDGKFN